MKVYFSHGKESGPWGSKIKALAAIAEDHGCDVVSIDYRDIMNPDERVERLLGATIKDGDFVLVGSSMGGYVSLVASESVGAKGVFLLAPALYLDGYDQQCYNTSQSNVEIVHGWSDDVIPVENSIRYAKEADCTLHLISGDHRLNSSLAEVEVLFEHFLASVAAGS